jgi:hypothetical protein
MAYERRRNGNEYYYRSHRERGNVVKEYIGGGELGRQAAEADRAARESRRQALRLRKEHSRPVDDLTADLDEFGAMVDELVTCQLLVAGAKSHHRTWMFSKNGRARRT